MIYDKGMIKPLHFILTHPQLSFFGFAMISAFSLAAAFVAQYVYGLAPCNLCIYQRWPFALVIALCIPGICLTGSRPRIATGLMGLVSLTFLANSVIASYHTGVERKWWPSFLEGCSIPEIKGNITDVLARIQAAPVVRCDEIPWTDPVLGLSMANYNAGMCLFLAGAALYAAINRRASSQSPERP